MWHCASCGNHYPEIVEMRPDCRASVPEIVESSERNGFGLTEKESRAAEWLFGCIILTALVLFCQWQNLKHLIGG